jgi:hypothetical protein
MADNVVNLDLLQRQLAQQKAAFERETETMNKGGGSGPHDPDMSDERIGRLEEAVEGMRHSQNLTIGATVGVGAILAAFVIGFGIYILQKVDTLDDKVNKLPAQISSDIRDITKTLAEVITATKQQPPQVILMPAPSAPTPK